VKVWVVLPTGTKLGEGRARLFELIDELGSIRKAVTQLGMSYRAAWGYICELEAAAGFRFLSRRPGGGRKGAPSSPAIAASASASTRSHRTGSPARSGLHRSEGSGGSRRRLDILMSAEQYRRGP
jgi:molybdate transport repressor ModE-like protein